MIKINDFKSKKDKKIQKIKFSLSKILNPEEWSLNGRFLYLPTILLILCLTVSMLYFTNTLTRHLGSNIENQLKLITSGIQDEINKGARFAQTQAFSLSLNPEIQKALETQDRDLLKKIVLPYLDRMRVVSGYTSLSYHFMIPPAVSFLNTQDLNVKGTDLSGEKPLASRAGEELRMLWEIVPGHHGLNIQVVCPITSADSLLGIVEVSLNVQEIVTNIQLPKGIGIATFVDKSLKSTLEPDINFTEGKKWIYFQKESYRKILFDLDADINFLSINKKGQIYYSIIPVKNNSGNIIGGISINYDAKLNQKENENAIFYFFNILFLPFLAIISALYLNIKRIKIFFARLRKMIIASHTNDFADRFETDHIHCLEVLHCNHEECPVHKNPSLVCYLETGSEAISPEWRNSCVFLNKYGSCLNCPVYVLRKGDELTEMRNVVNTMMRLWKTFLSRIGQLLDEVLRTKENSRRILSLDEVSSRLEQMAKLTSFSRDIKGVYSKDEVYEQLKYVSENTFHMSRFVIFEVNSSDNRMIPVLDNVPSEPLCKRDILLSPELCRAKRMTEEICSKNNPALCPFFNCDQTKYYRCCLPLVMGGQVGAVISFLIPKSEWDTRSEQLVIIRKYLDETAPVLASLRLLEMSKEQALRDPLTRSHNRRFLEEYIAQFEPLSKREEKNVGFLMVDLDYFKQVNDKYGHQAGDAVLKQLVEIMKKNIRSSDLLVRYGGEEFLVLLPQVEPNMSEKVAEKIRSSVEQYKFELPRGQKINKTVSIGVAEYPNDADTLYKAIKFADVALYEAKNQGRNRVVRFQKEMWLDDQY
ncbi:diguanylate cyclase [Desulfohalobiaceae bacterium Ax17]|uniref:diguanylate cyclase n=1 Tax=Desulfovulcanus ferrireducens TaxID=2831190 RepID=UPI00207B9F83|nr:diguanylate cyclase [Desulfovulcanus ferrireducens]MBT8764070.1 diguanylate cyclase [Desulfovulcanus ferrireducens]